MISRIFLQRLAFAIFFVISLHLIQLHVRAPASTHKFANIKNIDSSSLPLKYPLYPLKPNELLNTLLTTRHWEKQIILVPVDYDNLILAMNLFCSFNKLDIRNYIPWPLDRDVKGRLESVGISGYSSFNGNL